MMKKKGYKKGGVTKKMVGGAMKKKPIAMKKGGAPETSLRPKRKPPSLRPKARPSGKLPSTSDATPVEINKKQIDTLKSKHHRSAANKRARPASKEKKDKDSLLRPTRDGKAMTTKSLLQPRADGTGLTTDPKKMMGGGMMKKKGYAKGGVAKKKAGGNLKAVPAENKGLSKLPTGVRNKMGFKAKGGAMKKKGYAKGGKTVARGSGAARTQYFGKNG